MVNPCICGHRWHGQAAKPTLMRRISPYGCGYVLGRNLARRVRESVSSTNGHVRPCNLKLRQRDLTPVLRRPVEPACAYRTQLGHRAMSERCPTDIATEVRRHDSPERKT